MNPRVSILLCSYNQAPYLPQAIQSVLAQTCRDWELILVDNGSTDRSPEIAASFRDHPQIRVFLHRENRPITVRFNEGVRAARGAFIAFLYSDDLYLPGKLERQLELFEKLPPEFGVVYAPSRFRNQKTGREWQAPYRLLCGPALARLLLDRNCCYPDMITPLTRRECFLRHPFDETIFAEGEAIFLRIALTHSFYMDAEPVTISRDTGENRGRAIPVNVRYHMASLERLRADSAFDIVDFGSLLRTHQALVWRDNAYAFARMGGDRAWVNSSLRRAAALSPPVRWHPRWWLGWLLGHGGETLPRILNRGIDFFSHSAAARGLVEGYGGGSGEPESPDRAPGTLPARTA